MGEVDRRTFLRRASAAAATIAAPGSLSGLVGACARTDARGRIVLRNEPPRRAAAGEGGYGPLSVDTGELLLPSGFQARAFGRVGDRMADGNPTPIAHDGMAAFPWNGGRVRLVRNHEVANLAGFGPPLADRAYDPQAGGGTTTLELTADGELVADWVSLAGTAVNCAGGPTPWGSWLSCEETVIGRSEGYERTHGWIFEVPVGADGPVDPVPLTAMGRFQHEAIAVDPDTGIVYETEDNDFRSDQEGRPGSGLYRFLPTRPGELAAGGRLQVAVVPGEPRMQLFRGTERGLGIGSTVPLVWVDLDTIDPDPDDRLPWQLRRAALFEHALTKGAAIFRRLEGCFYDDGRIVFMDTNGGAAEHGQVWEYTPGPGEGAGNSDDVGRLRLVFESPGPDVLDGPDNVVVSPRGGVVICEDPGGVPYLRGLTPEGAIFDFARNNLNDYEFAGATFSPDGRTLFCNIQGSTRGAVADAAPGVTLAIRGPWERGAL
jgi:secreted PhoX family phosphatase